MTETYLFGSLRGRRVAGLLLGLAALLLAGLVLVSSEAEPDLPKPPVVQRIEPTSVGRGEPFSLTAEGLNLAGDLRASLVPDYGNQRMRLGGMPLSGFLTGLAVEDRTLFIASQRNGLVVAAADNLEHPEVLANLPLPGSCWNIQVQDGLAVIAALTGGVHLVDVRDPLNPRLLSTIETRDRSWMTVRTGNRLYIAQGAEGLEIVDLTDPEKPRRLGGLDIPGQATCLQQAGGYVYLNDARQGLSVIDVSRPSHPRQVAEIPTPGAAQAICLVGPLLVAAVSHEGLFFFDVNEPSRPARIWLMPSSAVVSTLLNRDGRLYVGSNYGVEIIDLGGLEPVLVGEIHSSSRINGMELVASRLVTVNFQYGIEVFDVSRPQLSDCDTLEDPPESINNLLVDGASLYYTSWQATLTRIDRFADPGTRRSFSLQSPLRFGHSKLWADDRHLYFQPDQTSFRAVERSDANSWVDVKTAGRIRQVATSGDLLLVADETAGLLLFDRSRGDLPLVGSFPSSGRARDFALVGSSVLLADGLDGLKLIDISSPEHPQLMARVELPGKVDRVVVSGSDAYAALVGVGVYHIDLSQPNFPGKLEAKLEEVPKIHLEADADSVFIQESFRLRIYTKGPEGQLSLGQQMDQVENFVFLGDRLLTSERDQVKLFRRTPGGRYELESSLPVYSMVHSLAGSGDDLFVLTQDDVVVQLTATEKLRYVRAFNSQQGQHLCKIASHLLVGGLLGVEIVGREPDGRLAPSGWLEIAGGVAEMTSRGERLYVVSGKHELLEFDLQNPRQPKKLASLDLGHPVSALDVSGSLVVVAHRDSGVEVLTLAGGDAPRLLSQIGFPKEMRSFSLISKVVIDKERVYLVDGENGLVTIDLQNPARPRILSRIDTGGVALDLALDHGRAYVAIAQVGVRVYDLAGERPLLVAEVGLPAQVNHCLVAQERLVLTTLSAGLISVPLPVESSRSDLVAGHLKLRFPAIDSPGFYDLRVFNRQGSTVLGGAIRIRDRQPSAEGG